MLSKLEKLHKDLLSQKSCTELEDFRYPCSRMLDDTTKVILPVNPTGNHWVAAEITSRRTIAVFDSISQQKVQARRVISLLDKAFPVLAHIISFRPSCH